MKLICFFRGHKYYILNLDHTYQDHLVPYRCFRCGFIPESNKANWVFEEVGDS